MEKLLIATTNRGKVLELAELLDGLSYEVIGLRDLPEQITAVDETGDSFAANAVLKSQYYFEMTGLTSLADDSGLEVDALQGAPGIYSARFAGENATDQERVELLLRNLKNVPVAERTARFCCCISITGTEYGKVETQLFEGVANGVITLTPRGKSGFGYDPVFEDPASGKTFAELAPAEKSRLSHRGRATTKARHFLEQRQARRREGTAS